MKTNYTGISGSRIALLAAAELKNEGKALILVSSRRVAQRLADDLAFFAPSADIIVMPEDDNLHLLYEARNREDLVQRIRAIQALAEPLAEEGGRKELKAVIAPISAALKPVVSRERFLSSMIGLEVGMCIEPDDLKKQLVDSGYEPAPVCESAGEFCGRGGILDVFSPSYNNPVRIEFFDDEIDSIRFYNASNQRSIENVSSIVLGPAAEFIPDAEEKKAALKRLLKEHEEKDRVSETFEHGLNVQIYSDFIDYFNIEKHLLWDFMADGICIVCDPARLSEAVPEYRNEKDMHLVYGHNCSIYTPFPEQIAGIERLDRIINVKSRQIASFNGQIDLFAGEMESIW